VDSFEWNKVFAAVIASVLLIMVVGTISEAPFHREHAKPAFTIEVAVDAAADVVVEQGPSFAELMAGANAETGARQWAKCRACHTVEKGGANGTGPNLYGIVGRTVAAIDGFKYSSALKERQGSIWTYEMLNDWIKSPKKFAKGTTMSFAGIPKDGQRSDLLAYLATFTDNPIPFPAMEAVSEAVADAADADAAETSEQ
jgi:cytochrome c